MQTERRDASSGPWALGLAVAFLVVAQGGRAFMPVLLTKAPVLLLALSPLPEHLLLVAPLSDPVTFVLLVTSRRFAFALSAFHVGRHYGSRALSWLRATGTLGERGTSLIASFFARRQSLAILVMPNFGVPLFAGAAGLSPARFVRINLLAQFLWATGYYAAGGALRVELLAVVAWVTKHAAPLTVVTVSGVVAAQLVRWRLRRRVKRSEAQSGAPQ